MRHIYGISGGKDSSALAVYMRNRVPDMEYFFCDTGAELPETYAYLAKLEMVLGKKIVRLNSEKGFNHYFEIYRGTLPSPQMRWCTNHLKIKPLEKWVGNDDVISYVAIRADEGNRKGYVPTKPNIKAVFPFMEDSVDRNDVMRILDDAGLNLPEYYEWRTRSGCYFCFFQRKAEWVGLADKHPDLFQKAIEQKTLKDAGINGDASFASSGMKNGQYTWSQGETLEELLARRDDIMKRHGENMERNKKRRKNLPLVNVLSDALDDDDDTTPCTMCHL